MRKPRIKDQVAGIWMFHDKHERWEGLREIEPNLSDRWFYPLFVEVWVNVENNDVYLKTIDQLIRKRGVTAEKVMPHLSSEDRRIWASLPDEFTVWRGTSLEDPYGDYSWTTDQDKARWFAERTFNSTPAIATGTVRKKDVLFVTNSRNEHEVAVRTPKVRDKKLEAIGPWRAGRSGFFFAVQNGLLDSPQSDLAHKIVATAHLMGQGKTMDEIKRSFYSQWEDASRLGFVAVPAKRIARLDALDWGKIEREARAMADATQKIFTYQL